MYAEIVFKLLKSGRKVCDGDETSDGNKFQITGNINSYLFNTFPMWKKRDLEK